VNSPFTFTPWTIGTEESGFTINILIPAQSFDLAGTERLILTRHLQISDLLPNTYNIEYANIIVYLPSDWQYSYSSLIWNTYPISTGPSTLPTRKWTVTFNNLTDAAIEFNQIRVITDGVRAGEGYFQSLAGPITGEYTILQMHLTFNTSRGEPSGDTWSWRRSMRLRRSCGLGLM
jgi:hypothetical protein